MANVYVRSGAGGAATGADWANAYLTLAAALTAKAAGDSFWVSEDHVESQASAMTNTSPGTVANPCFIYCVNHSGSVPPVSADLRTTASIATTLGNALTNNGTAYFYGIIFSAGSGANATNIACLASATAWQVYEACAIRMGGTAGGICTIGQSAATSNKVTWLNTTYQVASAGSTIAVANSGFVWKNTASAITGATLPTTLIVSVARNHYVNLEGVDLSALGSGNTLIGSVTLPALYTIKDCKLGASVTVASTPSGPGSAETILIRSDSSGTNYRSEKYSYMGTETVETTIVRTGGASDGTTSIAKKIVTTANSKWVLPFEAIPIAIWNDSTSAITTLTIYGTTTGGGVPKDDEIWIDVEYLGSSLTPQGSFITSSKADNLAASAATNNSADGSTWGGGGAGNGFKIVCPSFTPGQKGAINIYVRAAKASATYYIDPRPSISGVTVAKSEILAPGVYANELSAGGASAVQYRPSMSGNV
jgi:hypothetical protein